MTANFADLLRAAAEQAPDGTALVEAASGAVVTWRELDDQVSATAAGLERLGLVAGNRVLVATGNRPELVRVLLAVLRARMVAVPLSPRTSAGELRRWAADTGARLVVADRSTVAALRPVLPDLPRSPRLVVLDEAPLAGEQPLEELTAPVTPAPDGSGDPEALAVLLPTSGASSAARAAMLSHRALLAQAGHVAALWPSRAGDVIYAGLPLFHVYGLAAVLGLALTSAVPLVVPDTGGPGDPLGAEAALRDIERYAATLVVAPPALFEQWHQQSDVVETLADRLAKVQLLVSGSGRLSPRTVQGLLEAAGVRVHQGYGLTEAGAAVTATLASASYKPGSVGAAVPGVRVRVVDETGRLPEGADPGEVQVAGDQLFSGYWPDGADGPADGWFATGDLGFLDGDGDLFLVDRRPDTAVVAGFTVYPREVEEVVLEVEGVLAVAVVGIHREAGTDQSGMDQAGMGGMGGMGAGDTVVAWVEADPARRAGLAERVAQHCAARLPGFKQPVRIEVVDDLPRTASGKIAKGRLRALLEGGGA